MNKNTKIILIYSIIACLLLFIVENFFHPSYFIQMTQKILSFIIIPLLLWKYLHISFWRFWKLDKKSIVYWLWFWVLWVFVIWLAYILLKDVIDWQAIWNSMNSRDINSNTFIIIFLYIMFWNSFIEEYFFRWIVFRSLSKFTLKYAYLISSIMFSLYHIVIFWTWFKWYLLFIALLWLFIWWLFFAWLFNKTKGIWSAWIFHILADAIILIIWYITFFS